MSQRTARTAGETPGLLNQVAARGRRILPLDGDRVVARGLAAEARAHGPVRGADLEAKEDLPPGRELEMGVLAVEPALRLHALAGDLHRRARVEIVLAVVL